jgi:hypothetical protein
LSTVYTVAAYDRLYEVVDDCTIVYSAVITGAVTDEIQGGFGANVLTVQPARSDLNPKTSGGLYAIAASLEWSFPKLATQSYTVNYTLQAQGFRNVPMSVTVPAAATLPFAAPPVKMRRLPVRVQGRVVLDATGAPVAGAQIVCVDNPSPPSPPPPPPVPHTMLMRAPLYFDHAVNAPVQQVTLTVAGTAQLTQPAAAGSRTIQVNTTAGLTGSALVRLANAGLNTMEYATVASVAGGAVTLSAPLNRRYAPGSATTVQYVTPATAGPVAHLLTDANAGDGVMVADSLLQVATVVVDGGTAQVEYHEMGALTDANGYYAVDGVGRVREVFLRPNPGTPGSPVVGWFLEYEQPVNVVNFRV